MAELKDNGGTNLREKESPGTNFKIQLSNNLKNKKMKKVRHTRSAASRQKLWVINPEHSFIDDRKPSKNKLLSRNEVCRIMGWTQQELSWHIEYAGLPVFANKCSRSALRNWEAVYGTMQLAS